MGGVQAVGSSLLHSSVRGTAVRLLSEVSKIVKPGNCHGVLNSLETSFGTEWSFLFFFSVAGLSCCGPL